MHMSVKTAVVYARAVELATDASSANTLPAVYVKPVGGKYYKKYGY